ncbi:MAG: helix-turn-helix domain-containing protein [Egibacteraceae bacterium]
MPVVEDPPRLVGQLVQLARGLLALGLDRRQVLGMCTWAALHSIPQQRLAVLQALLQADESELTVSEIARRAGCHRQVARFALEELECVGVTRGPDDDGDHMLSLWRLDGDNAGLVRSVLPTLPQVVAVTACARWIGEQRSLPGQVTLITLRQMEDWDPQLISTRSSNSW